MSGVKLLTVKGLIDYLLGIIERKTPLSGVIRRPDVLISGLRELDNLIEMHEIKRVLVQQVQLLLITAYTHKDGKKNMFGHKLHTAFYGSPGVGKSKAARIIAKIWHGIGIVPQVEVPDEKDYTSAAYIASTISEKVIEINSYVHTLEVSVEHKTKVAGLTTGLVKDTSDLVESLIPNEVKRGDVIETADLPLCICGRQDFVGEYMGTTALKTQAFLNKNRGKVIVIEEAYLLYTGEKDQFGMEALTVLNRFMDEHADEVIIIFTGYKYLLLSTIFAAQPGLMRRCQWSFDVKGYSAAGLAEIFKKQITSSGWTIDEKVNLTSFFHRNYSSFPSFGGDTERLAFQVKLVYSERIFKDLVNSDTPTLSTPILTNSILEASFIAYKESSVVESRPPEHMFT